MNIEDRIIQALRMGGLGLAGVEPGQLEAVQEQRVYHLRTTPAYFIKWIAQDDSEGNNELWVNQAVLPGAGIPTPRLLFTIQVEGAVIAGWEWLEGSDLRFQQRDGLAQAFARLGYFHAEQRHAGPVESLVTRRSFDNVHELLEAECEFLCAGLEDLLREKVAGAFRLLEAGYPTRVHGDAHPGNIWRTHAGLKFVDWGYSASSLNLFDLGYIQTSRPRLALDGWWDIGADEAGAVLNAYYGACGMPDPAIERLQWAVTVWGKLWGYHNCLKNGAPIRAESVRQQLEELAAAADDA